MDKIAIIIMFQDYSSL